jgi:hypothetical protein
MNITGSLVKQSIYWQKNTSSERYFYAYNDGKLLLLRLNNFPDEPLLTLIIGLDILDTMKFLKAG